MATKNDVCREVMGLNTSEFAFVLALDMLDKAIPEHALAQSMLVQKGQQIKVLGEALNIYQQPLPEDTQQQVDTLNNNIASMTSFLKDYDNLLEKALETAIKGKKGAFVKVLNTFRDNEKAYPGKIAEAQAAIHNLRNANLVKANNHVADSLAKRRNNTGATNGTQPPLLEGTSYTLKGYGLADVILDYVASDEWEFSQNDKPLATSEKFPGVKLNSWTAIGKALRILSKSYTHAKENWTVQRGDLAHEKLGQVNGGGTQTFEAVLSE